MRIAVLGAGAIGTVVAGYLKKEGVDVCLIAKETVVNKLRDTGINIKGVRGEFRINIDVYDNVPSDTDLVILTVKTQDLEKVINDNISSLKNALVLTTQNGVDADDIVSKYLNKKNIVSSIIMFGATYIDIGNVVHNFDGDWIIGRRYSSNDDNVVKISKVLSKAFSVTISDNIEGMKWLKLFINSNNCIPAILNKSMQECFSNLGICKVGIGIWQEGLGVIEKAGIELVSLPGFEKERILKLTSLNREESAKILSQIMTNLSKEPLYGSILQSIKRGRKSEIDYINGAFVRLGKKVSYHTPLNKMLVELVHNAESGDFLTEKEFLDRVGNLLPRQKKEGKDFVNTPFPRLKLTVEKVEGDCYHGYKIGDEIILEDFTHPPKYFCLGLAHSVFPVIYALSFGAKFPFRDNQRSLSVTCPDGGKLSFKVEIMDVEDKVEFIPRDENYKGPQPKDLVIEVVKSDGKCTYGYKVGDKFEIKGLKCPKDFCGAAFHTAFPALFALNFGARFFFMDDPDGIDTVTCPDGGKIVFKVRRKK